MFFFLSKVLDLAFEPLTWSLLLLLAGALWRWRRPERRRPAVALALAAVAVLFVFGNHAVANRLYRALEDRTSTVRPGIVYDAVVLLGGVVNVYADQPEGRRSYGDNVERLLATYDLLREGTAKVAVISGGHPDPSHPAAKEAPTQADQLADWGIARERLVVESRARNTWENAVEVKKLAEANGWKTVLIVTSARHMARAKGCFDAVGLEVDTLVVDRRTSPPEKVGLHVWPRAEALDESSEALREWAGRLVYRVRGYSK